MTLEIMPRVLRSEGRSENPKLLPPTLSCGFKSGAAEVMSSALCQREASLSLRQVTGRDSWIFSAEFQTEQNKSSACCNYPFFDSVG